MNKNNNETLNTTYLNTSASNNRKTWQYFEKHGYAEHRGLCLHHKDITMKDRDPERYAQWNVRDLEVMTVAEHRALHMKLQTKGKAHTAAHNKAIAEGRRENATSNHKVMISQSLVFDTLSDAARYIGCSRQLVSQCLREGQKNKKAKGYTITLI